MRALLISACALPLAFAALAQETPIEDVYACASEADDAARLACYDAAVGRLKSAEEAGEITTVTREEVETVRRESFGFSIPSLPSLAMPKFGGGDGDGLEEVTFAVASIRKDPYGKLIVTLENGQVWLQTDSNRVSYSRRNGVEEAVIKTASMGSFRMKLDGGRAFRVERQK